MAPPFAPPLWPPADLAARKVSWYLVDPGTLYRITRADRLATEPYFGRSGGNRFDAPAGQFGVCHAAATVMVCFAETIIRSPVTNLGYNSRGELPLSEKMLSERVVMGFRSGARLRLIKFTGAPQLRLGADSTVSAAADYAIPQSWSLALHDAFPRADGILYMSRHINNKTAVAIFDRAKSKLTKGGHLDLLKHHDFPAIVKKFAISLV